jgi:hypothetical protein
MYVLEIGVNVFYQPLEEEVGEHQHLKLVPQLVHERHEYLHFLLSYFYHHLEAHLAKKVD